MLRYNGKGTPPRGAPDPLSRGAPSSWSRQAPLVMGGRRPLWWGGPLNILPQISIFWHCLTPKKRENYPGWAISNQKNSTETKKKHAYFLMGEYLLKVVIFPGGSYVVIEKSTKTVQWIPSEQCYIFFHFLPLQGVQSRFESACTVHIEDRQLSKLQVGLPWWCRRRILLPLVPP